MAKSVGGQRTCLLVGLVAGGAVGSVSGETRPQIGRSFERSPHPSASARALPDGVYDATAAPWRADPTGRTDSTRALQAAINASANDRATLFIPAGRYMVTDTLNCTIDWPFMTSVGTDPGPPTPDFRYAAHVIVGARRTTADTSGPRRTTLFVPPRTPGFTSETHGKYVMHLYHTGALPTRYSQPDININQIVQGLDIVIGEGNVGAVGVMHLGAQGSSLEDVTVWAGDAAVGIAGGSGGGGAHANVKVVGGRFGLDFRAAQPCPTVTGATLINQSCSSLVYYGRGPLTMVGARFEQHEPFSADSLGAIAAGLPLSAFRGECQLPIPPHEVYDQDGTFSSSLSIVDSTFASSVSAPPAIHSSRGVYLRNAYASGYSTIVQLPNFTVPSLGDEAWTFIGEFAASGPPPPFHLDHPGQHFVFNFSSPLYLGGRSLAAPYFAQPPEYRDAPPTNVHTQHLWNESTFPSFQTPGVVDARVDCGASGDGKTDDHAALQKCLDSHDIVVVPRGFYRLSSTLVVSRRGGALVGVGRTSSVLMAAHSGFSPGPILRVVAENAVVYQIEYITFWHIPKVYCLDWQGENGIWRQAHGYRTCDFMAYRPEPAIGSSCAGWPHVDTAINLNQPLSVISGGGKFYTFYVEDWHFQGPGYRHYIVNNSKRGVTFYHTNPDCSHGEAAVEVAHSSGVNFFGTKAEGNTCQLWIRESSGVLYTGFGGFATPWATNTSYPEGFQQYTPSMIRVEKSTDITLSNLWGDCRVGPSSPSGFGGVGVDPRLWSFVLWQDSLGPQQPDAQLLPPLQRPTIFKL